MAETKSPQRPFKRRSEGEQRETKALNYSSSDESPKGRKLRKLPSLENLDRSPSQPTPPGSVRTSTPRLNALGDRLTHLGKRISENPLTASLLHSNDDGKKMLQSRSSDCTYRCPHCRKQFKYLSNLKSHLRVVHKTVHRDTKTSPVLTSAESQNRQKTHECDLCLKKFKYSTNLKTHRKVHSSLI